MNAFLQAGAIQRQAPIRAIVEQNREQGVGPLTRPDMPWGALGLLTIAAVCAAVFAWTVRRRAQHSRPPSERAFSRIARKLGLGRQGRALVREIAVECQIDPLALLVSPNAVRGAMTRIDSERWRARRGWREVAALAES